MSLELVTDDDVDAGDLDDVVGSFFSAVTADLKANAKAQPASDARRALERYFEEKQLRERIRDPLYDF